MLQHTISVGVRPGRVSHVHYLRKFLELARTNGVEIFTSTLTVAECTHATDASDPDNHQKVLTDEVKRLIDGMLTSGKSGVMPVQPVFNIVKAARDFRWVYGVMKIAPLDALHVATAMHMKCDYFVTTDQRLKNMLEDISGKIGLRFTTADAIKNLLPTEAGQFELVLPTGKTLASGGAASA